MRYEYCSHFIETETEAQRVSTHSHIPGWCLGPITEIVIQFGYSQILKTSPMCCQGGNYYSRLVRNADS